MAADADPAEELARVFARAVRAGTRLSDQAKETLRTRDLIAMARGVVMARRKVSADEAFRQLTAESHSSRRPLREVAAQVVESHGEA